MDASASSKVDAAVKDVYTFFLKIDNNFPTASKQKNTAIKYTKLPEFDYETKGARPRNTYKLQPRLRRVITLEEPNTTTTRSLRTMNSSSQSSATANITNRKIVTISEDDEYDLHPKFTSRSKKSSTAKINKAVETEPRKDTVKKISQRNMSRLAISAKYSKEAKCGNKINKVTDNREASSRSMYKSGLSNQASLRNIRSQPVNENETTRKTNSDSLPRTSLSKNYIIPSESKLEMSLTEAKLNTSLNSTLSKKNVNKTREISSPPTVNSKSILIKMQKKSKLTPVIHVPLERKKQKRKLIATPVATETEKPTIIVYTKPDGSMDTEVVLHQDKNTNTEPPPKTVDAVTHMESCEPDITYKYIESTDLKADLIKNTFDKLDIPNVSLTKEKINFKEEVFDLHSESLPNLQIPPLNVTNTRKGNSILDTHYCKSTSYIIKSSTLTYKAQQKINFHVVDKNDKAYSNQSPSQLKYPLSVMSVFKEEMSSNDSSKGNITLENTSENKPSKKYKNCVNEIKSLNCSYIPNSNKLMKPSDIISTIKVNNGLLQSVLVCEQFQRELNFIDSFFESLQYLESCSISENCCKHDKTEQIVSDSAILDPELNPKNSEYDKFFSKLESGANSEDSETIASKNLFLLNILIRDEKRRAKNLLYVLKRREDALKDFTKSQILYLENKKKQDNTDISALKKKQRGALLKLQHECGEMHRMRKALVALSEKRKVALMKTKKDLELKLKNNVSVDQVFVGKKKLKRNTLVDRTSPLKCFDLSSSGCEDSASTSRSTSDDTSQRSAATAPAPTSAEKSIQTSESILELNLTERSICTADENFIVVDGSYLNILFHNLTLPQIFSGVKQYEVNKEALKNIVDSTNTRHNGRWSDVVEKLISQSKNEEEGDRTSTPSTARSLVEEFEQYYKTLAEDDHSSVIVSESRSATKVYEGNDAMTQTSMIKKNKNKLEASVGTMTEPVKCVKVIDDKSSLWDLSEEAAVSPPGLAGPLPAPVGTLPTPAEALPTPVGILLVPVGHRPARAESLLAPAGSLLAPAGSLPAAAGSLPVPTVSLPVPAGSLPASTGSLPALEGSLPVPVRSLPALAGSQTASTDSIPVPTGPLPVPAESLPAPAGCLPAPAGCLQAPAGSQAASVGSLLVPAGSLPAPVEYLPVATGYLPSPAGSLPAPVGSLPAPMGSLPAPVGSLPAPVESLPAHAGSQLASVGPLPVPAESLPAPAGCLPAPAGSQATSVGSLLAPAESLPAPAGSLPAPAGSLPAPTGSLPAPAGSLPVPVGTVAAPTVNLPAPAVNLPSPAVNLPSPAVNLPAPAGPLPVPTGADAAPLDDTVYLTPKSSNTSFAESSASSQPPCEAPSSPPPISLEPSQAEAEELRRQQLAIEREIKELEQQQCRLLVVREIPDKPPPPYTPPAEARPPQKPRPFKPDAVTEQQIRNYVLDPANSNYDVTDAFDVLVHDFSEATLAKHRLETSDKPWDACNLLPQKPAVDLEKLIDTATNDLTELLTAATPSLVSGVSSRRSDHIDDILFTEWRRAEPEWTSLHNDEALIKNQLFDNIFQKILTDTVDEYKRTVLDPPPEQPLAL